MEITDYKCPDCDSLNEEEARWERQMSALSKGLWLDRDEKIVPIRVMREAYLESAMRWLGGQGATECKFPPEIKIAALHTLQIEQLRRRLAN